MLESLQPYQGLIALAVSLVLALGAWAFRANVHALIADRATARQVQDLADQIAHVDRRVLGVEQRVEALPTGERITRLALDIEALRGDFRALAATLEGTNQLLRAQARKTELIDEYLRRLPPGGGAA
jgi:hypothetical protein